MSRKLAWKLLEAAIRRGFPDVPVIGVDALDRWLRAYPETAPVLIDGRDPGEYAVSHLPGARLAPDVETAREVMGPRVEGPIVVYCSVGYRSARLARALRAEGFNDVRNLEGSIFQWARKGLPLVRAGERVRTVHPFGAPWSWLIEPELRAEPG